MANLFRSPVVAEYFANQKQEDQGDQPTEETDAEQDFS
jgi:hypothetical protein